MAILWLGWEGGFFGEYATEWLDDGIGSASVVLPVLLCAVGGLMLVRSALVTLTPFKAGLVVTVLGLFAILGADHGGLVGRGIGGGLARVVGETGSVIIGVATLLAGAMLLTGASAGALLRRSGSAVRTASVRAGTAARRTFDNLDWDGADDDETNETTPARTRRAKPPIDGVEAYPDVIATGAPNGEPPPLLTQSFEHASADASEESKLSGVGVRGTHFGRCVPATGPVDPEGQPTGKGRQRRHERTDCQAARRDPLAFRRRRHDRRPDRRAKGGAVRASAGAGNEGLEGGGAPRRSLLRARDDRDPHPGADPGQAGGRGRGAEPRAAPGHARRHLRRDSVVCEPAERLARQGHRRQLGLDRPGADASPAHRRHHRIGQVGLHQHAVDVDPAARDTGRGADDPDRPQADRAQLLRVDPASPDARCVQPEGGVGSSAKRRREMERRYERLSIIRARNLPEANRTFKARGEDPLRTCSS